MFLENRHGQQIAVDDGDERRCDWHMCPQGIFEGEVFTGCRYQNGKFDELSNGGQIKRGYFLRTVTCLREFGV